MGDHLTNLHRRASPRAELVHPLAQPGASAVQWPLRYPAAIPLVSGPLPQPFPAATRQFLNHPIAFYQAVSQMRTKLLKGGGKKVAIIDEVK